MNAAISFSDGFVTLDRVRRARAALSGSGALVFESVYSPETCEDIKRWMDAYPVNEKSETHYQNTELRIWDSQKHHDSIRLFFEQCNVFLSCLTGADTEAFTMLAIRNRAIRRDDSGSQLGRWHIDSFRHQYKLFLFLTDVDEQSGPFEFLPGTQQAGFKTRMAMRGVYFKPSDLLKGSRRYASIDERWVAKITESGYSKPSPVLCTAGSVMVVDTSAIHRARPCFGDSRYALTAYFR
jgi:hypothetical protein